MLHGLLFFQENIFLPRKRVLIARRPLNAVSSSTFLSGHGSGMPQGLSGAGRREEKARHSPSCSRQGWRAAFSAPAAARSTQKLRCFPELPVGAALQGVGAELAAPAPALWHISLPRLPGSVVRVRNAGAGHGAERVKGEGEVREET